MKDVKTTNHVLLDYTVTTLTKTLLNGLAKLSKKTKKNVKAPSNVQITKSVMIKNVLKLSV